MKSQSLLVDKKNIHNFVKYTTKRSTDCDYLYVSMFPHLTKKDYTPVLTHHSPISSLFSPSPLVVPVVSHRHHLLLYSALQMMGKTDGDNYTLDDMFVSGAAQREGEGREEERMRNQAIGESRRLAASMEKCQHCFSSQELQKHLIVAIGSKVRDHECALF